MATRRQFLSFGSIGAVAVFAGCISPPGDEERPPTEQPPIDEDTPTETQTKDIDVENPTPTSIRTYTDWEPNTNCNDGERESMYNSEISVTEVVDSVTGNYYPIQYEELPTAQKQILAEVIELGGYATCETSTAFNNFLEKAVYENGEDQPADNIEIYLEYDGTYYQLYLRKQDQVYAY